MPELPEVETICRAISPLILNQRILTVSLTTNRLRWPIPDCIVVELPGQSITEVTRRGKYLLFSCENCFFGIHLGMSGNVTVVDHLLPMGKHDHLNIEMGNRLSLRFCDPRRFGAILWSRQNPLDHPLLKKLGPEPLDSSFNSTYLYHICKGRNKRIKELIMAGNVVAGIGNMYANDSLFRAGILPERLARSLSENDCMRLADAIKITIADALKQGEEFLKKTKAGENWSGYFAVKLLVYGRNGQRCVICGSKVQRRIQGGRSTYFCPRCQK